MTAKKIATKTKEVKTEEKPAVTLVSYTIKAVIPTGPYANIQPEITINAPTLEEAEAFALPHIADLFEKFMDEGGKSRVTLKEKLLPKVAPPSPRRHLLPEEVLDGVPDIPDGEPIVEVERSESFHKARNTILACRSLDALEIIFNRIHDSVKLSDLEKMDLTVIVTQKRKELGINE